MKGLLKAGLVLTSVGAALAGPLRLGKRHAHIHDKRALVVLTKTQDILVVEVFTSTVYVDPATIVPEVEPAAESTTSTAQVHQVLVASQVATTSTTPPPPPPPPTTSSTTTPPPPPPTSEAPPPPPPVETTSAPVVIAEPIPTPTPKKEEKPIQSTSPNPGSGSRFSNNIVPVEGQGLGPYVGEGTFYDCGLGSCGITNTNSDMAAALSKHLLKLRQFDDNPNNNKICVQKIRVWTDQNPTGIILTVTDKCPECAFNNVDICAGAFDLIGDRRDGRIQITWEWVDPNTN